MLLLPVYSYIASVAFLFQLHLSLAQKYTECGGTFTGRKGVIRSPNYPKRYPNKAHCVYNILASKGARIEFTCIKQNIEKYNGCRKDYMKVNGLYYCGRRKPMEVYGETKITVEFVSNGKTTRRGFSCKYEIVSGKPYVETTSAPTTPASTTPAPTTPASTTSAPTTTSPITEDPRSCELLLTENSSWDGGWTGNVGIPVMESVTSWNVQFEFTAPVISFEQWIAVTNQQSDTEFSVINTNSVLTSGNLLSFDILYRYNTGGVVPKIKSIKFNGKDVCEISGGTMSTTSPESGTTITQPPYTGPGCIPEGSSYNYDEVLHKSLLFYEAQRSGDLPETQRVIWRKDSATDDALDADTNQQVDLEGGYYDAGDYVKFGYPMAAMTTVLAWGAIDYGQAYYDAGEMSYMKEAVKWATDYFIKAHPEPNVFYGQVGDGVEDHNYWGQPEDMTMARPAWKLTTSKPGSDLAGETAAALAATSILFKESDPNYAAKCLQHAKDLYSFADQYRGQYAQSITNAAQFYNSWGTYLDELAWAAAWLYRATNDADYLNDAISHYNQLDHNKNEFSWAEKTPGVQVLLTEYANEADRSTYRSHLKQFCDNIIYSTKKTPKGLVFIYQWGSLRYAANVAFICLRAADLGISPEEYRNFGKQQIHYMLGDAGRSFVVGFGHNPPMRPHHASSSCPPSPNSCGWDLFDSPDPNTFELIGALVGGPDENDNYVDDRTNYIHNEVTTDYNAGFQSAVAALRQLTNCFNSTLNSTSPVNPTTKSSSTVILPSQSPTNDMHSTSTTTAPELETSTQQQTITGEGVSCNSLLTESSSWNAGWNGKISIPVETDSSSWNVEFEFTSPLSSFEQWTGETEKQSNILYTVTKEDSLEAGSTLAFDFLYRFPENEYSEIKSISFNGQTICTLPEPTEPTPPEGGYTCGQVTITNEWDGNYQMELSVTFPVAVTSWTMVLTFNGDVDAVNAYTAIEDSISGPTVTLSNENYNGVQSNGAVLVLGMQISYSSAEKPLLTSFKLNEIDLCVE